MFVLCPRVCVCLVDAILKWWYHVTRFFLSLEWRKGLRNIGPPPSYMRKISHQKPSTLFKLKTLICNFFRPLNCANNTVTHNGQSHSKLRLKPLRLRHKNNNRCVSTKKFTPEFLDSTVYTKWKSWISEN